MDEIELAKRRAAQGAIPYLQGAKVIGIGTGTTVRKLIELIAMDERFTRKAYLSSSFDTALSLMRQGLYVLDPFTVPHVDVYIDGADEVDPQLNMIKGGGAALTKEKILAYFAKKRIFIVDYTKLVQKLGRTRPIPLEVIPSAMTMILRLLKAKGYEVSPRLSSKGKYGPIITDTGGIILDLWVSGGVEDPAKLHDDLKKIPGVIETGIFVDLADVVIVGYPDGFKELKRRNKVSKLHG